VYKYEIFVYEFCFTILVVALVQAREKTIEIFVPFIDGEPFNNPGSCLSNFASRYLGADNFGEIIELCTHFWANTRDFYCYLFCNLWSNEYY
jgi:hypothetical protein